MERTSNFEKLLFLYKTEGKIISLELYCIKKWSQQSYDSQMVRQLSAPSIL